jgi:hypothetical protein
VLEFRVTAVFVVGALTIFLAIQLYSVPLTEGSRLLRLARAFDPRGTWGATGAITRRVVAGIDYQSGGLGPAPGSWGRPRGAPRCCLGAESAAAAAAAAQRLLRGPLRACAPSAACMQQRVMHTECRRWIAPTRYRMVASKRGSLVPVLLPPRYTRAHMESLRLSCRPSCPA